MISITISLIQRGVITEYLVCINKESVWLSKQDAIKWTMERPCRISLPSVDSSYKSKYNLDGEMSLRELWRRIAMLGGFLGRKSDGNPGWQTIWKGWLCIQDMLAGMAMFKNCG
jgi:hypothetical protein